MSNLPADAVTALAQWLSLRDCRATITPEDRGDAVRILDDIAPAIRDQATAAERARIRQLALQANARYAVYEMPEYTTAHSEPVLKRFADLLDAEQ